MRFAKNILNHLRPRASPAFLYLTLVVKYKIPAHHPAGIYFGGDMARDKKILQAASHARAGKQDAGKIKSIANLRPIKDSSRAKELGSIGGKARSRQKQKLKTLREYAEAIAGARPNAGLMEKIRAFCPEMATKDATMALAVILRQAQRAAEDGDINAAKYFSAVLGQDPGTQLDITSGGKPMEFAIVPNEKPIKDWLKNEKGDGN